MGKYVEGSITPLLSILYDLMRKIEIGGGIISWVNQSQRILHLCESSLWKRSGGGEMI